MTSRARVDPVDDAQGRGRETTADGGLGSVERGVTAAVGGLLAVDGVRRRSLGGAAMVLAGGWLLARAVTGQRRPHRALDVATGGRSDTAPEDLATSAVRTVTVRRSPEELSELWHDPEQVNRILGEAVEVTPLAADRWRWTVRGPLGSSLSWESRIVEDRQGEVLGWTSLDGAPVPNEGSVRFRPAPADLGTEVTLVVRFDPPGGAAGRAAAPRPAVRGREVSLVVRCAPPGGAAGRAAASRLGLLPRTLVGEALHRFKSLAETGEIPTLERNPSGRGSGDLV